MPELTGSEFELVFEGPADDSADTLRKIKGAFIADLELSISEVQEILSSYPLTIKHAASPDDLQSFLTALKNAGGKVMIVQKSAEDFLLDIPRPSDDEEAELTWVRQGAKNVAASDINETGDEAAELEFEFDAQDPVEAQPDPQKKEPKMYSLSLEEESIIPEYLLKQAEKEIDNPADNAPLFSLSDPDDVPLKSGPLEGKLPDTDDFLAPANELGLTLALDPEEGSKEKTAPRQEAETPTPASKALASEQDSFDLILDEDPEPPEQFTPPPAPPLAAAAASPENSNNAERTPEVAHLIRHAPSANTPLAQMQRSSRQHKPPGQENPNLDKESAQPPVDVDCPAALSPLKHRKKRSFLRKCMDLLAPLMVGMAVLSAGNWYYFSRSSVQINPAVMDRLLKTMGLPQPEEAAVDKKSIYAARHQGNGTSSGSPLQSIEGESSVNGITVRWKFPLQDDKPSSLNLSVTTPRPPDLTPEEIVANRVQTPWLKKITIESRSLAQKPDGSFLLKATAKTYVEQNHAGFRLLSQAMVRGMIDPLSRKVSGQVEVKLGLDLAPNGSPAYIEQDGPGKYRFYVSVPFGG